MPMALVLVSGHRAEVLSVHVAHKLADLGITGMTVLGDERALALVLEGWAFDPARASEAAEAVLPAGLLGPLILETQFHVAVRCGPEGGSVSSLSFDTLANDRSIATQHVKER